MTYLITFAYYGSHLHGHPAGSVDRRHNLPGSRMIESDSRRAAAESRRMIQEPYHLDSGKRKAVLAAMQERCTQCNWTLPAAHARSSHVHIVIEADVRPERIMNDLKSYASRYLNRAGFDEPSRKRWARHGSTRWLWKPENIAAAIRYVVEEQG